MQKFIWKAAGMFCDEHGHFCAVTDVDAHLAAIEEADNIWHETTRKQTEALRARVAELESLLRECREQVYNPVYPEDEKALIAKIDSALMER